MSKEGPDLEGTKEVPWDTCQDSPWTDTLMLQPHCSRCSGELVFAKGDAPLGTASEHLLPGCWLWLWACHVPGILLQAWVAGQDGAQLTANLPPPSSLLSSARSPCCCFQALHFLLASS